MRITEKIFILSIMFLSASLSGCVAQSQCVQQTASSVKDYGYGNLCPMDKQCFWITKLKKHHVVVNQVGDKVSIDIPFDAVFIEGSVHTLKYPNIVLDEVSELLKCYQKMNVEIITYFCKFTDEKRNHYLSNEAAKQLVEALGTDSIDARMLSYKDSYMCHGKENYIEVITQRLP